jgi:CubicO group peptidase (beta-lactamase class C family)
MTRPRPLQRTLAASLAAALAAGTTIRGVSPAQTAAASIAERTDALFADWDRPGTPGCSVAVGRGGATVFAKGYGLASLEHGVPITPETAFHVASVTKPVTAMSVQLLARAGALSLDDPVGRHVPGWASREPVAIRHLLSHTSGVREAFLLIELASPREGGASRHDQLVGLLARQRGGAFAPGSRFAYNNGAYTLLAEIVRRASGQSLRAFAAQHVFRPLGMTRTAMHDDPGEVVPRLAGRYTRRGEAWRAVEGGDGVVGNAGMVTTAGDMLAWLGNFDRPRVGDAAMLAAMQAPITLATGETSGYGLGVWVGTHRGRRTIGHGGGDPGVSAYVVRYPDDDLSIAVLCNADQVDSIGLSGAIADLYLGAPETAAPATAPEGPAVTLSAAQLAAVEGLYRESGTEGLLRMFVRDGTLRGSPGAGAEGGWPARPLAPDRFLIPGTPITLRFAPGAGGTGRTLHIDGGTPSSRSVLERVEPYTPAPEALRAFAGDYRSEELDSTYVLATGAGEAALTFRIPGRSTQPLQAIRPDAFAGPLVGLVTFQRDAAGAIGGFTIHDAAARGIRFERVRPPRAR